MELAAGGDRTCARLQAGNFRCWGAGILGYGNTDSIGDDETPASAGDIDVGDTVVDLDVGHNFNCARLQAGDVRCWGACSWGCLGYGNNDYIGDDETPAWAGTVDVGGVVVDLVVGPAHTCARLENNNLRCWGPGDSGQLGYGNTDWIGDDETPASAGDVDVGGAVTEVAVGGKHTCARLQTGAVRCWGSNHDGQLGYANTHWIGDDEPPASAGDVSIF